MDAHAKAKDLETVSSQRVSVPCGRFERDAISPKTASGAHMETLHKYRVLIGFYLSILLFLLLCVIATPLMIRHGILYTHDIIIGEETFETALIVALFGISFFIIRSFLHTLKTYQREMDRVGKEKSRLVSRLAEAFNYIGTVNVEMQEIESVLCGVACYPQNKREFGKLVDRLAAKAMTVAAVPWLVVRVIDRHNGKTAYEHAIQRLNGSLPSATLGNRAILDGRRAEGVHTIGSRQCNLDLVTVFILPETEMTEERTVLLMAILNQIEMLFMLYRAGCLKPVSSPDTPKKELIHDSYH